MPLDTSCSTTAHSANISQSIKDGKPQVQSLAVAFSVLKKACGVTSDKRMTAKEIVQAGGSESKRPALQPLMHEMRALVGARSLVCATPRRVIMHLKNDKPTEMALDISTLANQTWEELKAYADALGKFAVMRTPAAEAYKQAVAALHIAVEALQKVQGAGDSLYHHLPKNYEDSLKRTGQPVQEGK